MDYCTAEDLVERLSNDQLIQLTDDATPSTGIVNLDIIARAISAAQETIDGYLRGRYTVPLVSIPGIVKNLAIDLTEYNLFHRRNQAQVNEAKELIYKKVMAQLKDIQAGIILLENAAGTPLPPKPLIKSNKKKSDRIFNKKKLGEF